MKNQFPKDTQSLLEWKWADIEPFYQELLSLELTAENANGWLKDWSDLTSQVDELFSRLYIATTQHTADPEIAQRFNSFLDSIQPLYKTFDQKLKQKLLASRIEPAGFELPLLKMRTEASLYREANLPLFTREQKLCNRYNQIIGGITYLWEGEERTASEMSPLLQAKERGVRKQAWLTMAEGRMKHRAEINDLWQELFKIRLQIAQNAGKENYREYIWEQKFRFDYTPEDCKAFHRAIETAVVPAVERSNQRKQAKLGLDKIRPWDRDVDPFGGSPLKPCQSVDELKIKTRDILGQIEPDYGRYFQRMMDQDLLDLESRKNKAPGAYSLGFAVSRQPFIFMSATGTHADLETLFHESGHAMHEFERAKLEYFQHRSENYLPAEFAEVASMGMELLMLPYLARERGGFYEKPEASRATVKQLEDVLSGLPYLALVDAFQHWIYENPDQGQYAALCEDKWAELWDRFMKGIDFDGYEDAKKTFWHRQLHIFIYPFYYIEYAMAQIGALQVWSNSLKNPRKGVADYRAALALGSTAGLPKLFETAGAKFSFDTAAINPLVDLIENTTEKLRLTM